MLPNHHARPLAYIASLLLGLSLSACADQTSLIVEVTTSDLEVPADIDAIRFLAETPSGSRVDRSYALDGVWPQSLAILPNRNRAEEVRITVLGFRGAERRVERHAIAQFTPGSSQTIVIELARACLDRACPDVLDCRSGRCLLQSVDAGVQSMDASIDAGTGVDAGERDAGSEPDSSTMRDAGPPDAGPDAGPEIVRCASAASACVGRLVISEFRPEGPGGAADEFVEIYNRSNAIVDASDVGLFYTPTNTSSPGTRASIPSGTELPPGGYLLLGSMGYDGPTPADIANAWSSGFADRRGSLTLQIGATVLDRVTWARPGQSGVPVAEGSPVEGLSDGDYTSGASLERAANASSTTASMAPGGADALAGNGRDSDDNSVDFLFRATAQPQNASSGTEP